ncbi:MAG: polymer-forming cytoskeletal protein [Treponema sp.]|jgi:cytoskeletal protein CcmA (bactofilin family)|nr:polymer-forming cytoskeletal protein [Treponema sp.]
MAEGKKRENRTVVFSETTRFDGFLKFKENLCIRGTFHGTIEAHPESVLIVDKGAVVEADHISVSSLTVHGYVSALVYALDKVDLYPGAELHGDITTSRFRIADGVLFEGQCNMTSVDREVEIFSRPTEEIKAELRNI